MSKHGGTSILVNKASSGPSNMAQDSNDKETIYERKTIQALVDSFKESPYSRIESILISFPDTYGQGYFGMEIGNVGCRPKFLQKIDLDAVERRSNSVQPTSHPNLLNLMDISVCDGRVFLHYERPGISLAKIQQFKTLDRIAVATMCKKMLHGLIYIHDVLNISHGNLHCENIYLNDDGEIKIGDIGQSMIQTGKTKNVSRDVQAVCNIADRLLNLDGSSDKTSMSWIMAKNFVTIPSDIDPRTLLRHPFFRISQDSWYLSWLGEFLSFNQTKYRIGCSKFDELNNDEDTNEEGLSGLAQ